MGEVYRARDSKLDREVAIKILPQAFASDGERVARFRREAKALAALNHSNIAAIYGIEEIDSGALALVLELVEGETLADLIRRGPVPLDEALPIAHGQGFHRPAHTLTRLRATGCGLRGLRAVAPVAGSR